MEMGSSIVGTGRDSQQSWTRAARVIASGSVARLLALPIGALCTALTAYISIRYAGADNYGYISLVATLFLLVPFADFGLGAAVINAVAESKKSGGVLAASEMQTIWRVIVRISIIALFATIAAFVIAAFGGWRKVLKLPADLQGADFATATALSMFFMAGIFGVGARVFVGLGRVVEMTAISVLTPLTATLGTYIMVNASAPFMYLSIAPALGNLIFNMFLAWRALKYLGCSVGELRAAKPPEPAKRLMHSAFSFFVMTSGVALALQSHRIVLSYYSTPSELAAYSLMAQMYLPVLSLTYAGTLALWSAYKKSGDDTRLLWISSLKTMAIFGIALGAAFGFASPALALLISSGEITPGALLAGSLAALIVVTSIHQASGFLLTDESGLRFQAYCVVVFASLSVSMSILLAGTLGAAGPVLASVVAFFVALLVPGVIRARKTLEGRLP
jgi:O-antigen/teichoic acid export membrane protein